MGDRRNSHCFLLGKLKGGKKRKHLEDLKEMGGKKGAGGTWNRLSIVNLLLRCKGILQCVLKSLFLVSIQAYKI